MLGYNTVRKISGLNGDVTLSQVLNMSNNPIPDVGEVVKKNGAFDAILEESCEETEAEEDETDLDQTPGEEVRKIAGKGLSAQHESDDLILHLVSTSMSNINDNKP